MKGLNTKAGNENIPTTKIWVKTFRLNDRTYCYDVATNNLMQINEVLHDVLANYNYTNKADVLQTVFPKYTEKDIFDAIKTIEEFNKKKGGFNLEKRIRLKFPFTEEEYRFLLDNFLSHLVLNISDDCPLRCRYCVFGGSYKYRRAHKKNSMSFPLIKKAVDFFIPRCKLRLKELKKHIAIGFYGGEPLMEHRNMFKTVEYIKEKYPDVFPEVSFSVTTNGLMLTEDIINNLIKYDVSLAISLDGPEDIHDRNRVFKNGKGTHETIMKNIEMIKSINREYFKNKVNFSVVLSPEYDVNRVIDFFRKEAPDQELSNVFSMVEKFDTNYFDSFNMDEENKKFLKQTNEVLCEFIEKKIKGVEDPVLFNYVRDDFANIHNRKLFSLPETTYPNGCCTPGVKRIFVDTKGKFHTCEKGNLKHSIGDVNNGFDIKKIFNLIELYAESSDHCNYCWAIRFCNACFLSAIKNDKFSKHRKEKNCQAVRNRVLNRLQTYICLNESNPKIFDGTYYRGEDMVADLVKYMEKKGAD